jgi:hypothetical protein
MKTKTQEVHRCDHCSKHYLIKSACEKHEPYCSANPVNATKCFDCAFFEQRMIPYFDGSIEREAKTYFCDKMGIGVYPAKALRTGLVQKHPGLFADQIQMPHDCNVYQDSEVKASAPF